MTFSRKPYIVISVGIALYRRWYSDFSGLECRRRIMTTKLEDAAKQDFKAEVSEWIEAFDDVVADDWKHGEEAAGGIAAASARGWGADAKRDGDAVSEYDSEA